MRLQWLPLPRLEVLSEAWDSVYQAELPHNQAGSPFDSALGVPDPAMPAAVIVLATGVWEKLEVDVAGAWCGCS